MVNTLRVILWDEEIGRLAWDEHRRLSYFIYNPEFLKKGIDVSPLQAPVRGIRAMTPVWGEDAKMYQKLPAFLADSLPDAWGNQLFELWRIQNHIPNADITPLDKLSFIGKRGMGALEFLPEVAKTDKAEKIDVKSLADLAERIFSERENAHIMPEESITMQSLLTVGTSAGGRQPKAIIAINKTTGEIRSGQVAGLQDYDYYILKFGDTKYSSAEIEMTYYEMAIKSGIDMMPSRLYEIDGNRNFITKRFDRDGERKLHINNTDDHTKNFSFVMDEAGLWRLSPAYDLTYIIDTGGYLPNTGHCMYVRSKLHHISYDDAILFAKDNGIRRADAIIREVADSLRQFRDIAKQNEVQDRWISSIESAINAHLVSWGLEDKDNSSASFEIDGKSCTDVRIEQAYKGNFHLYASIDGRDCNPHCSSL